MADKAQKDKEKGNIAFKAGDYPAAIGHYTAAILADRGDATFPLNRAAAYLKLGKNEDAERDCTTVLSLSARNVKAYFRRGQARVGLGHFIEAQRDFTEALRLEPDNKTTKEELEKVAESIEAEKRKKPGHREINSSTFNATLHPEIAPKRRRVPITIVEPPTTAAGQSESTTSFLNQTQKLRTAPPPQSPSSVGEGIQEASSRALKQSSSQTPDIEPKSTSSGFPTPATPATPSTSSPSTSLVPPEKLISPPATPEPVPKTSSSSSFTEFKQAREARTMGKVGGGIFRASGQSTIFPSKMGTEKDSFSPPSQSSLSQPAQSEIVGVELSSSASVTVPVVASNGSTSPSVNDTSIAAPATLFDLVRAWRSMLTSMERWKLLQTIPPSAMSTFCKTSLEPPLLDSLLEVFLVILSSLPVEEDVTKIREYMEGLAKVPRFPTLILFLTNKEKAIAKEVWRKLGVYGKAPGAWSSLGDL